jgi:hypothetical protein
MERCEGRLVFALDQVPVKLVPASAASGTNLQSGWEFQIRAFVPRATVELPPAGYSYHLEPFDGDAGRSYRLLEQVCALEEMAAVGSFRAGATHARCAAISDRGLLVLGFLPSAAELTARAA